MACVRQFLNIFNYSENITQLKYETEKLEYKRAILQHSVDEAMRKGDAITQQVVQWLTEANDLIQEAERVIDKGEETKSRCCCTPKLKDRYQIGRKAEKAVSVITEFLQEGKFDRVSHRKALPDILPTSSKDGRFTLGSRESILKQILDALKDSDVNMIGIYGTGGTGKTTLAREVCRRAIESELFDVSVMVVVSQTQDIRKIQEEIADQLDLQLMNESLAARSSLLQHRLKMIRKILLVLDDVWRPLDLEGIGIPFRNGGETGCKILLTSRSLAVSHEMDAQRIFRLEGLTAEESWSLFKKTAGITGNPAIAEIAKEIVNKCAGLPVAIVSIARTLKDEDLSVWKDALYKLSRVDDDEIQDKIYSSVSLSYNHLDDDKLKSFLLLCGMLGKYEIPTRDLLKYSMGLGLLDHIQTVEDARNRVHQFIDKLERYCLLGGEMNGHVRIHDVIQDVAVSIASREQKAYTINGLRTWPDEDSLERCTRICLPRCNVVQLPEILTSPKLEFFLLGSENPTLTIPDSFFQHVPVLQVLDLSGLSFTCLPRSLGFLKHLRTLCLDHCVLDDIVVIGELKKVEILTLVDSDIVKLPREIGELSHLKLLDLSHCSKLQVIPANVLAGLVLLEELYMVNSFVRWEMEGLDNQTNASLGELVQLSHLTILEIQILDARILPSRFLSMKLESYKVLIGDAWDWNGHDNSSRMLKFKPDTNSSRREDEVRLFLKGSDDLSLAEVKGMKNILYDLSTEGFPQLKHLSVQNCPEIQYLVDAAESTFVSCIAFPVLQSLLLENLMNLEKICHGQPLESSFSCLTSLTVRSCNELKNLFSFSMVGFLGQLQEIEVTDCSSMTAIVEKEQDEAARGDTTFSKLKTLTLVGLENLTSFCFQSNAFEFPSLENVTVSKCPKLRTFSLGITSTPKLERVLTESFDEEKYLWDDNLNATIEQIYTPTDV